MQRRGLKPPFFCAHPIEGSVSCYLQLARYLGADRSFYGIQPPFLNTGRKPFERIEEAAHFYLIAIRKHQPSGPYLLGGWSFGGLIALEIAQLLAEQREKVGLLALIDTPLPVPDRRPPLDDMSIIINWVSLFHLPVAEKDLAPLSPSEQLYFVFTQARAAYAVPSNIRFENFQRYWDIYRTNYQALWRYLPRAYPQALTLLVASEQSPGREPVSIAGWRRLAAGGLTIYAVPGDHLSLLREPHVRNLAVILRACLDGNDSF